MSGRTSPALGDCLARPLRWRATGGGEFPYSVLLDGQVWTIRVNDFPAQIFYTLLIDGVEIGGFDDWPPAWIK